MDIRIDYPDEYPDVSPDDILEETRRGGIDDEPDEDILPEDNDRPAAPGDDLLAPDVPEDHPIFDYDRDPTEVYNLGDIITELPDDADSRESL